MKVKLYRTGEIHTNSMDVYREVGEPKNRNGKYGMLGGQYYVGDSSCMYVCGNPYKDQYGVFDGEPSHQLKKPFVIVKA